MVANTRRGFFGWLAAAAAATVAPVSADAVSLSHAGKLIELAHVDGNLLTIWYTDGSMARLSETADEQVTVVVTSDRKSTD